MELFLVAIISFFISLIATAWVKRIAIRLEVVDRPGGERKIHTHPIPLWGGLAIFLSLVLMIVSYLYLAPPTWYSLIDSHVRPSYLIGMLVAGLWLLLGGMLDDKYQLKPYQQIIWPILASLTIISSGMGIERITNPFGGVIALDTWNIFLFDFDGTPHYVTVWSDIFTFAWLMGVMYTTKLLDGLDGLVSGITVIGATIIALLSLYFFVNVPTTILAIIIAGIYAGFLVFNFHPASIFLGEAGSTLAGFFLGVLAIISGAKVATTLLILGIPMLDALWVVGRRVLVEHRSPFSADKKHLHFRLLAAGFSQRQAVLLMYFFAACFGVAALFLQSPQKVWAILVLGMVMAVLGGVLWRMGKHEVKSA